MPSNTFVSSLYGLAWGEEVYAKIVAYNIYGNSAESVLSNPTVLMADSDVPINLQENIALRSFTQVAFTWQDGLNNNGSPIVSYTVSVATGVGSTDFTVLQTGVPVKKYTATSLIIGETYNFRV